MINSLEKKTLYFERLNHLFAEYSKIILVDIENISSNQFKKCRKALSKHSILILGKNKIIKKVLKEHIKRNPELNKLLPYLTGNIGFIFTKIEVLDVKKILQENKVPALAKVGQIAPEDVVIPSGITNLTPDGTVFFQALNIQTKIAKGLIEIQNPVKIITKGNIIGNSEVILLQKLELIPFSNQFKIRMIFENNFCIDPAILEISMEEIEKQLNCKKEELLYIESLLSYLSPFKIEKIKKKTIMNLVFLSQHLGYENNQESIINSLEKENSIPENSTRNEKIIESEKENDKSQTDDEDMGFGLFD